MPLIKLTCPSCNGQIELDDSREFGFCVYCGTKVMIQDDVKKIKIDDSYKIDSWLSLCSSAASSKNYDELSQHAIKIIESDAENSDGWFYKGLAEIWKGNFESGYDCWAKSIGFSKDEETIKSLYQNCPQIIFSAIKNKNLELSLNQEDFTETDIGDISIFFDAFDEFDYLDEDDGPYIRMIDYFVKDLSQSPIRINSRMYDSFDEIVYHTLYTFCDLDIILYAVNSICDYVEKMIKITSGGGSEDTVGSIMWDSVFQTRNFYKILKENLMCYAENLDDTTKEKISDYWSNSEESPYLSPLNKMYETATYLISNSNSVQAEAKRNVEKYAEEYVDTFFAPFNLTKKKRKKGLFNLFKI